MLKIIESGEMVSKQSKGASGGFEPVAREGAAACAPRGMISDVVMSEMSEMLASSVQPSTAKAYSAHFKAWTIFLKAEVDCDDPYMRGIADEDKALLVGLMMLRRRQAGHRGKKATGFTAALRRQLVIAGVSTVFMDSKTITTSRAACQPKPHELRAQKDAGASATVKLPICESILVSMKVRLWEGREWSGVDMQARMTYLGCMWGFEMGARVSEYTQPEPGATDHCVRTDDITFVVDRDGQKVNFAGSMIATLGIHLSEQGRGQVVECRVRTVTTKGKVTVKDKLIGRRSAEEAVFLEEVFEFVARSGAAGDEEMLSCARPDGSRLALRSRAVREELKRTCESEGLPPTYFSSHSLRKGAITHMRALGASEDDRRDRGNYAPGSQVMNSTYDYADGLGPSAANSLTGGYKPTIGDVKRLIPAARRTRK